MKHGEPQALGAAEAAPSPEMNDCPKVGLDCEVAHAHADEHDHDHAHHHHDHSAGRTGDRRRLLFALGLSGVVLVAEVIGGLVSGSLALLSDAGHVLTDMSSLLLSLFALMFAARPADARRTFGFHRLEILSALANGVVLVGLSAAIVVSSVSRFAAPPPVDAKVMLPIAIAGLLANVVAIGLLHGANTLNVRGAYLHVVSDTLSSVAVVAGGALMLWRPGLYIIDPILGTILAALVLYTSFRLLREAVNVLLEAAPRHLDVENVRGEVCALPGVEEVHDLHIWTITSGLYALSAHIVIRPGAEAENDALLRRVKELLHKNHRIAHSTLQIESSQYEHVTHVG
jgi:cobalt-zinc-cadmium efflux system protein